jgi:cysteine desulfurase
VAAHLGLGAAVDYLLDLGIDEVRNALTSRAEQLRTALGEIPQVRIRDLGRQRCGIVSFTVDGVEPAVVRDALADHAVTVTVSSRASTLLDMQARGLTSVVRASPHYFVRPEQIDSAAAAIATIAAAHR